MLHKLGQLDEIQRVWVAHWFGFGERSLSDEIPHLDPESLYDEICQPINETRDAVQIRKFDRVEALIEQEGLQAVLLLQNLLAGLCIKPEFEQLRKNTPKRDLYDQTASAVRIVKLQRELAFGTEKKSKLLGKIRSCRRTLEKVKVDYAKAQKFRQEFQTQLDQLESL